MHLRRLQLQGFKSFALHAELEFHPGITAIVGPNGCGKSNIADAIIWALGEHNPRELRAPTAADLIFTGTEKRRGLGLAQVRLTVDNAEGELPIDFSEVEVTRRVERSGEGEYLINRAKVRRRDIQELFLTTGVGRQAYAVITQNHIDAVLSADPQQRRQLIEEAAGVSRYRFRRQETLNRLEGTERHLARLRDVLAEVEAQVEPLVEEAEKARTYKKLTARLEQLELSYLLDEFRLSYEEVVRLQGEAEALDRRREHLRTQAAALETQETQLRERIAQYEAETDDTQSQLDAARRDAQSAESQVLLARHSQNAARERIKALAEQAEEARGHLRQREEHLRALRQECDSLTNRFRAVQQELEAAEADLQRAETERGTIATSTSREAQALQAALETIAVLRRERSLTEGALEERRALLEATRADLAGMREQVLALEQDQRRSQLRAQEAKENARAAREHAAQLQAEAENLRSQLDTLRQASNDHREALAVRRARLSLLQALQQDHEGHTQGVKALLQAARRGEVEGQFVPLSEAIEVEHGYAALIEAALGRTLGWVLCGDLDQARAGLRFLAERRAGRATFVPASLADEWHDDGETLQAPEGWTCLTEVIKTHDRYRAVVHALLGRLFLCNDLARAEDFVRGNRSAIVVGPDGTVVGPWPSVSGGGLEKESVGPLARREEIASLPCEIARLESELAAAETEHAQATERLAELERALNAARDNEKTAEAAAQAADAESTSSAQTLAAERARLGERERQAQQIDAQVAQLLARAEEVTQELTAAEQRREQALAGSSELQGELAGAETQYQQVADRLNGLRTQVATLTERLNASQEMVEQEQRAVEETRAAIQQAETGRAEAEAQLAQAQAEEKRLTESAAECRRTVETLEARLKTLREQRTEAAQQAETLRENLRATGREETGLSAEVEELRSSLGRLTNKRDSLQERLAQEFGLVANDALRQAVEAGELENREEVGREVRSLRAQIKALGEVNIGAIGHFDRLTQRRVFLQEQILDLEEGAEGLRRALDEIDQRTRTQFAETFERVAQEFSHMFATMFGGGYAELRLTDAKNILEAGVEVQVHPPGKDQKNLLALSGGEKALTAIALVFALLKVKPPPFCILDEVDAPLDDANVERFCSILDELAKNTQFLMITHNKITMEHADYVYGVTMREPGVSTVYSLRVAEYAAN